jgi:hypothetical protein
MSWLGVPDDTTPETEGPWPWRPLIGVGLTALGIALCITLLFFAMRGIMDLGGFVAHGGPYVIAHPAPDWVWLVPVSIVLGMMLGFANAALAAAAGGFNLAVPAWSAVFLSLGWNFAEYGFSPPSGQGLVWGWIVCAVAFFVMGLAPLLLWIGRGGVVVERVRTQMLQRREALQLRYSRGRGDGPPGYRRFYLALNVGAVIVGVVLGTLAFWAVAGGRTIRRTTAPDRLRIGRPRSDGSGSAADRAAASTRRLSPRHPIDCGSAGRGPPAPRPTARQSDAVLKMRRA